MIQEMRANTFDMDSLEEAEATAIAWLRDMASRHKFGNLHVTIAFDDQPDAEVEFEGDMM